ncbi:hypothetical protein EBT31_18620 [bacterium]|jgi:hypothetical protein|nr:hypothetical protein [bacterium]
MTDSVDKLYYLKRAKSVVRDSALMSESSFTHPLVEKTARAISNWQSESDWPLHVDEAIRSIEVVAEQLGREGHREAKEYLQSVIWREPKHRVSPEPLETADFIF